MEITTETWPIEYLIQEKDNINPQPQYQRTPVWNPNKKQLLIDSILRGYDLPKFYIRKTPSDPSFQYEVIDGQQRMRAIWEFVGNEFPLGKTIIAGVNLEGKYFQDLKKKSLTNFNQFSLTFSLIEDASPEEIRSLFARLQMGVSLNPVELRHAKTSNIGNVIQMVVNSHKFFKSNCKITNTRYKHQDYLDHAIALLFYGNKKDLKARVLDSLYKEYADIQIEDIIPKLKIVNNILDWMWEINSYANGIFRNKWGFVDTFYFLLRNFNSLKGVKGKNFANELVLFEKKRTTYNSEPEKLIENVNSTIYDKNMYNYIISFNIQGALIDNVSIRANVFDKYFRNKTNLLFK